MKLQTEKEITRWLDSRNIHSYTVNQDLSVDVDGNVDLSHNGESEQEWRENRQAHDETVKAALGGWEQDFHDDNELEEILSRDDDYMEERYLEQLTEIPVQFGKVRGDFDVSGNLLKSLEGAPTQCEAFVCSDNPLKSLGGCKTHVETFHWTGTIVELKEYVQGRFVEQVDGTTLNAVREQLALEVAVSVDRPQRQSRSFTFAHITPAQPCATDKRPALDIDLKGAAAYRLVKPSIQEPSPTRRMKI